jgi:hypothetical protein
VTGKVYMMSWSFSVPHSGRTSTVTSRSNGLSVYWRVTTALEKPAFLPFVSMNFRCNSRLLSVHGIKSVSLLREEDYSLGL